jgi:STAS domain-containing protein
MSGDVSSTGPLTLSVTLPAEMSAETGAGSHPARLAAGGVLDRDGLAALIHLAHVGVRRGCRELVVDVHGLTDFPSALFAELRKLADVAGRRRCRLRLDGLDTAVAAAVDVAGDARDAAGNAEPGVGQRAAES